MSNALNGILLGLAIAQEVIGLILDSQTKVADVTAIKRKAEWTAKRLAEKGLPWAKAFDVLREETSVPLASSEDGWLGCEEEKKEV